MGRVYRTRLLAALSWAFSIAPAWANDTTVVAVFPVQTSGAKFDRNLVSALTDYVSVRIASVRGYSVVPRADLEAVLRAKKAESYEACYDSSCQIEVGNEVSAQQTVVTQVIRIAKVCTVSIAFFDLRMNASISAQTAEGGCTDDELLASVREALGSVSPQASQAATPPPRQPRAPTAVVDRGSLVVSTEPPSARIHVDGLDTGLESPAVLTLEAGERSVEVLYGRLRTTKRVQIRANGSQRVQIRIEGADSGTLTIRTKPTDAQLFLDNEPVGRSPMVSEALPLGPVEIRAVFDDGRSRKVVTTVRGGESTEVELIRSRLSVPLFVLLAAGGAGSASTFETRLIGGGGVYLGGGLGIDGWTAELDLTVAGTTEDPFSSLTRFTTLVFGGRLFELEQEGRWWWQPRVGLGFEPVRVNSPVSDPEEDVRFVAAAEPATFLYRPDQGLFLRWTIVRTAAVPSSYAGSGFEERSDGVEVRFTTLFGVVYAL